MDTINLSIQTTGGKHRFGISVKDSAKYFKLRNADVVILYRGGIFYAKTSCGQFSFCIESNNIKLKKGFDLFSSEISDLIKSIIENNEFKEENGSKLINVTIEMKSNFWLLGS